MSIYGVFIECQVEVDDKKVYRTKWITVDGVNSIEEAEAAALSHLGKKADGHKSIKSEIMTEDDRAYTHIDLTEPTCPTCGRTIKE